MHFFVNNDYKVIFGWSGKCGCSHLKKIYYFLRNYIILKLFYLDIYINI